MRFLMAQDLNTPLLLPFSFDCCFFFFHSFSFPFAVSPTKITFFFQFYGDRFVIIKSSLSYWLFLLFFPSFRWKETPSSSHPSPFSLIKIFYLFIYFFFFSHQNYRDYRRWWAEERLSARAAVSHRVSMDANWAEAGLRPRRRPWRAAAAQPSAVPAPITPIGLYSSCQAAVAVVAARRVAAPAVPAAAKGPQPARPNALVSPQPVKQNKTKN